MKNFFVLSALILFTNSILFSQYPSGEEVLRQVDKNLHLEKAISNITMVIKSRTGSREIKSKTWIDGKEKAFVEYTFPPREKGKKMLKLQDKLWAYFPEPTDRIITISGHLLKQSVMGSDLSYEDITDNNKLADQYNAAVTSVEKNNDHNCYVVELTAIKENVTYYKRKIWVDQNRWVPLKEERYAKSGKPLKRSEVLEVIQIENRYYPKRILYRDLLQNGNGTEYIIESINLDPIISESQFTKAALKK